LKITNRKAMFRYGNIVGKQVCGEKKRPVSESPEIRIRSIGCCLLFSRDYNGLWIKYLIQVANIKPNFSPEQLFMLNFLNLIKKSADGQTLLLPGIETSAPPG
jgi:hypothetical protein